jgi:hypothetical protein
VHQFGCSEIRMSVSRWYRPEMLQMYVELRETKKERERRVDGNQSSVIKTTGVSRSSLEIGKIVTEGCSSKRSD